MGGQLSPEQNLASWTSLISQALSGKPAWKVRGPWVSPSQGCRAELGTFLGASAANTEQQVNPALATTSACSRSHTRFSVTLTPWSLSSHPTQPHRFFFATPQNIWDLSSLTWDWTRNSMHWKSGILTTRPPGDGFKCHLLAFVSPTQASAGTLGWQIWVPTVATSLQAPQTPKPGSWSPLKPAPHTP